MKKLTFLLVFISIFGYSQTPILPSIQERLPQEFMDRMNPNALTPQVDEFFDMNQNVNNVQSQLFQREMLVQDGNYDLRLDSQINIRFSSTGLNYKIEYTYDANGNLTLDIGYNWDTDSQSFFASSKREFTYDANGNRTFEIWYNWNTDSQSFVPSSKREFTYDANNFKTNETSYSWNAALGVYKPTFKMDISIQSETDTNLVREGITYEYDTNFNTWNELEGEEFKSYWYYTKVSTLSAEKVETLTFAIYPNPTENTLFITGNETPLTIAIYNVLGKEVLSLKNTNNINVQALPSGVYMIRISDGVGQTNRKFIKN